MRSRVQSSARSAVAPDADYNAPMWLLIAFGCAGDGGSGRVPGTPPVVDVQPLRVTGSGPAGLEDLVCQAGRPTPLRWRRGDQPIVDGAGTVVVHARDVLPGSWTCEALDDSVPSVQLSIEAARHNVLVVLADDIGIDNLGLYGIDPDPPATPTLDTLAAQGLRFENAWALPECSPTRAALLTGRYPRRHGIGSVLSVIGTWGLQDQEVTVAELLREGGYATAAAGKWHLGVPLASSPEQPLEQGFDHHAGSLDNLEVSYLAPGQGLPLGYWLWEKTVDGQIAFSTTYATLDTTDEAIAAATALPEPWFLYVAYNAAHSPWHTPPDGLSTATEPARTLADAHERMVESVDTELGRLLDALGDRLERTTVVFLADNGTPVQVVEPPVDPWEAKGTSFEGGSRVPFLVWSPLVREPGVVSEAFVSVVDILPTAAALAGLELDDGVPRDGHSLLPYLADPRSPSVRDVLYSEKFEPNGFGPYDRDFRVVRDRTHRYVVFDGVESLSRYGPGKLQQSEDLLASGSLSPQDEAALARLRLALRAQEDALGIQR